MHIRHLNPLKKHTKRITKQDKKLINALDCEIIEFPASKKYFNKIEVKKKILYQYFLL